MDLTFKIKKQLVDTLSAGDHVLVAVSGGIDSTALLHIFMQIADDLGIIVSVVHINHKLRGVESDKDEKFVRALCKELKVDLYVAAWKDGKKNENLQEAARAFRYDEFKKISKKCGANKIAVAHNMNDQAETLILNLTRGSGLEGISGMRSQTGLGEGLSLIRPLLATARDEIELFVKKEKIKYREDATNKTTKYSRNFVRHEIIPRLQKINPNVVESIAATASSLQVDDEYIESVANSFLCHSCGGRNPGLDPRLRGDDIVIDRAQFAALPHAIRLRVLKLAYNTINGSLAGITRDHLLKMDAIATDANKSGTYKLANNILFERAGDKISLKA